MKTLFLTISIFLISATTFAQAGFEWAQACGHPFYGETKSVLDADPDGNIFMAGNFIEIAEFGTEVLTSTGGTDIFFAKHNAAGDVLWAFSDGGDDYDYLHDFSATTLGLYASGSFYGTTNIGDSTFISMGSQDLFIARYDNNGAFQWAQHIGSPKTDYIKASIVDGYGSMIITGHYYDSISFGDTTLYAMGGSDIFLAKYDMWGSLIWVKQASGSSSDQSYSVSCDPEWNIILTGSFFYDIQIDDVLLTTTNPTGVFLAKYDNNGVLDFAQQVDGNGLNARSFASCDSQNNIFFTGNFTDQVRFGPYIFEAGAFNIDIFITKYDQDGNLLWADHGHSPGSDQLISISAGPLDDLYISGHYMDTIYFSDLTLKYTLCCGSAEIFMVRYTADGIPIWGDQISGERAMMESMVKNANDELFVSGLFQGELSLGDIVIESGNDYSNFLTGIATAMVTNTAELVQNHGISVYPNPATDQLYIKSSSNKVLYSYELINMSGRLIKTGVVKGQDQLDVSSFPPGLYVLKFTSTDSETVEYTKVIVR
jgi:hypothetical protein